MASVDEDRTLKIVVGYLAGDRPLRGFRGSGLAHRIAFVLDSYRAAKVDAHFDSELYAALIDRVREVVGADLVTGFFESGGSVDVSPTEWRDMQRIDELLDAAEPFERVVFLRRPAVVAVAALEPYVRIGGYEPYHDSYCVPVFTKEDVSEALVAEARIVCSVVGATITGIHRGHDAPHGR
jgi:hypothetical protein